MSQRTDALYEKRLIPRQQMAVPIHCQLSRKDESGFGWVRDFSSTGASVISSLRLKAGDELTLMVPKEGQPGMTIVAMVRWSQGPLLGVLFTHTPRNARSRV